VKIKTPYTCTYTKMYLYIANQTSKQC